MWLRVRPLALALLSASALSLPLSGALPSGRWSTVETPHSRIHFRPGYGPWATRLASRIEAIHERVAAFVGFSPSRKFDVVVTDPVAEANGMAVPFLDRPYIVLFTTAPGPSSAIGNDRDWIELLAVHEDAHLVHLLRPQRRGSRLIEFLLPLGPLMVKCPRWVDEGYATLVEGALTGSGRPYGSYRAMVLRRRALDGLLPSYGSLNSTEGWQGGSMAYLAGSAYLEWLEQRQGSGSLVKLWKRLAGRDHPSFNRAFKGVFGEEPAFLYARFVAETAAKALEAERSWGTEGIVEGERWQRLVADTKDLTFSKDGSLVAAVRQAAGPGRIDVWTVGETPDDKKAAGQAAAKVKSRLDDPEEVADLPDPAHPRPPKWTLRSIDGYSPASPRFLPDGRLLFVRKAPDGEGILHADLWVWKAGSGQVERITRLADVREADPSPDGAWALGVTSRFGASGPARVDLETGNVLPLAPPSIEETWTSPRVSADGRAGFFVVRREGRWRLLRLELGTREQTEVDLRGADPVGPVAFSADGRTFFVAADRDGSWNIEEHALDGGAWSLRTRVRGGALSPAPSRDGGSLLFLNVTSRGIDIQKLALPAAAISPRPLAKEPPIAPKILASPLPPPAVGPVPPETPYRPFDTMRVTLGAGSFVGPAGFSQQVGLAGDDLIGRLRWQLLGGLGDGSGESGGSLAAAWRGLPVALRASVFYVDQETSRERIVSPSSFDRSRLGASAEGSWTRRLDALQLEMDAGALHTRIHPKGAEAFSRTLGFAGVDARLKKEKGRWRTGLGLSLTGSAGRTAGESWTMGIATARASVGTPAGTLAVSGGLGTTGSSPTPEDSFRVGSVGTSLTPRSLDLNRIESPALPEAYQAGSRVGFSRIEACPAGLSWLILYAETFHAFTPGVVTPGAGVVRLTGAELRISGRDLPVELGGSVDLFAGLAKIHGDVPGRGTATAYFGFVVRP